MPRFAWFSPLPPVRSGIAQYNWELLPALSPLHHIDIFVDGDPDRFRSPAQGLRVLNAHEFLWRHLRERYDLVVYQLGNARCHDYMWPYVMRYPGLVVLHDGQLHHARGRLLLQNWPPRQDEYRQEFWFNHPDARKDLAELGAVGLLGSMTYFFPMLRTVIEASRALVVHNAWLAEQLREMHSAASIHLIEMGVPAARPRSDARVLVRRRHGISEGAVLFVAFGKVTPEKRLREALRAIAEVAPVAPEIHLLLAGDTVDSYDLSADADALGIRDRLTIAGYVEDEAIDDYLAAADVCLCLRWPTSRETSASWLRCLAAGKPTVTTDLVHTVDMPTLDPRDWSVQAAGLKTDVRAAGVGIDILDEDHSLRLAFKRLATDAGLRATLGAGAQSLWAERFTLERMIAGYARAIESVLTSPSRKLSDDALPRHLRANGCENARTVLQDIGGIALPDVLS